MIPVKLIIEGIYSYQERQIIDFSDLTSVGLFGIFGAVGSGKSSILEAISYALYGETERLNARDKRTYNMMNLKSNRSYIEFDFYNFENRLFRATREFKRNSKNFEDVKSPSVVFYEFKNEMWIPLEHSDTEKIIGLSYTNFKRTIIIPQGQFKEFLELGETDRTRMMKEIFGLERYDLQDNVARLNKKNQSFLDQLQGKLSGFESVSEEQINLLKEQLIQEKETFAQAQKEHAKNNETFQRLKNIKAETETLNAKKTALIELKVQENAMKQLQENLNLYERTHRAFFQLLNDLEKVQNEQKNKSTETKNQQEKLRDLELKLTSLEQNITEIKPQFDVLEQKKSEERDLLLIANILKFSNEIAVLKERTKNGLAKVEEVEAQEKLLIDNINVLITKNEELNTKRIDSQLLMEVGDWFNQAENLQKQSINQLEKISEKEKDIASIDKEILTLHHDFDSMETLLKTTSERIENQRKALDEKRKQLELQQQIAHYAHALHHGEACPLCGALEHPNIVETADVSSDLANVLEKLKQLDFETLEIQKLQRNWEQLSTKKQFLIEQLQAEKQSFSELQSQINAHKQQFDWDIFDAENPTDFEAKRIQSVETEQAIEANNKMISDLRNQLEKERANIENYRKHLEKFRLEETQKEAEIASNKTHIQLLHFEDFQQKSEQEVMELHKNLSENNQQIQQKYQAIINEIQVLSPQIASQKTLVATLLQRIEELKKDTETYQQQLQNRLQEERLHDVETVQKILQKPYDLQAERERIQSFKVQLGTLQSEIQHLEDKLQGVVFDENIFEETRLLLIQSEEHLKNSTEKIAQTNAEITRLANDFEQKKALLKEREQLEKRAENLKTLKKMFDKAGFVQYVASVYLRQLCDYANVRFHRMTRNQLSLQLNERNDFEIVDYLNEGRSRSVKTLSGGQSFQASLSLALALAESVQTNAKASKNFFFIDEGFGTQDAEAVNIVFETLQSLQKENRIVGIISHVEELKDRIPKALTITKDEEKGSLVSSDLP